MRVARAAVVSLLALTLAGCANGREFAQLTQFFAASRLRDLTALNKIATVVFEPAVEGTVTSFEITGVAATVGPDGHPMTKDVSIVAPVRRPSGETVMKTFVVTLSRGVPGSDQYREGRWLIVRISERPGPAPGAAASTRPRQSPTRHPA